MKCESCQTEFTGEACPNCGLKPRKQRCKSCSKKFYSDYLKSGFCPECLGKLRTMQYKSPYVALGLSILPGLGHRYIGATTRGTACLFLFLVSCWTLILIPFTILFSGIDAYLLANKINKLNEIKH